MADSDEATAPNNCRDDNFPSLSSDYESEDTDSSVNRHEHQSSDHSSDQQQSDLSNSPDHDCLDQPQFSIVSEGKLSSDSSDPIYTLAQAQGRYLSRSQSSSIQSINSSSEQLTLFLRDKEGWLPPKLDSKYSSDITETHPSYKRCVSESGIPSKNKHHSYWPRSASAPMRDAPGLYHFTKRIRLTHTVVDRSEEDRALPVVREYAKRLTSIAFGDSESSSDPSKHSSATESSEDGGDRETKISESNSSTLWVENIATTSIEGTEGEKDDPEPESPSQKKEE